MKAILQSSIGRLTVNRDTRVVEGVKLLENNRDVVYAGTDGKPIKFRTNEALLSALIGHAGNRTIPSHLSHEHHNGQRDGLHSRVGGIKNCRLSAQGDLIGDFHAMPGADGDKMLWLAENDPEHAMLSVIFDYNKIPAGEVDYAYPLSFDSADFVAKGAGVSAMLSAITTETDMTEEQINKLVDERVTAALSKFTPKAPEGMLTKAEAEKLADERIKAALAEYKPKMSEEDLIATEAKFTARLGTGPFQQVLGESKTNDEYSAKLAEYKKTAKDPGTAIARLLRDHPNLGAAHEAALAAQVAKLHAA